MDLTVYGLLEEARRNLDTGDGNRIALGTMQILAYNKARAMGAAHDEGWAQWEEIIENTDINGNPKNNNDEDTEDDSRIMA